MSLQDRYLVNNNDYIYDFNLDLLLNTFETEDSILDFGYKSKVGLFYIIGKKYNVHYVQEFNKHNVYNCIYRLMPLT